MWYQFEKECSNENS